MIEKKVGKYISIRMGIAIGLGLIVPMKKVNDGIEKTTKTKGFALQRL